MGQPAGQAPARAGGKSGEVTVLQVWAPPFYAVQHSYNPELLSSYGWSPSGSTKFVKIIYSPPDAPRGIVAGMVSVPNEDLSEYFDDNTYRAGVAIDEVHTSLTARIDAAQKLIAQGGGEELAGTQLGRQSLENLEHKVALLEHAVKDLDTLKQGGWTHVILVTGWQETSKGGKLIDHLDLNDDFFTKFYPPDAFPLAGLTPSATLVNRDYFLRDLLPEGFSVIRNRVEGQVVTCATYPRLKITFNLVRHDVLNTGTGKKSKLVGAPAWPTVEDVTKRIIQDLNSHWLGKDGDRARKKAYQTEYWYMVQEEKLRKRKKDKEADKYKDAREKIDQAIGASLVKEHGKLGQDLDSIKDPLSSAVSTTTKELLYNLGDQLTNSSLDLATTEEVVIKDGAKMSQLWVDRGTQQAEDVKKVNPLSKDFARKVTESSLSLQQSMTLGVADSGKGMANLSGSLVDAMVKIIDLPVWHGEKFWNLFNTNWKIGGAFTLPEDKRKLGLKKNQTEMERQFLVLPSLKKNRYLITLIRIHVRAFGQKVPDSMLNNTEISEYVAEMDKEIKPVEVPYYNFDPDTKVLTVGPEDPNRVK